MIVSYRWLKDLAPDLVGSARDVAARLAMYGAAVDELVALGEPLRDVIIGRVLEVRRHPNADRLSVCKVDAGGERLLDVVCGAPNVAAGRFYPFAPVGSTLPGGLKLEQRKIRGQESQGMLCSARELGLGRDHEGILELGGRFTPGASFIDAVGLDDYRLLLDVTPNRPDLLSHYGVARELSPSGEAGLALPPFPEAAASPRLDVQSVKERGSIAGIEINIDDHEGCPRYLAGVVRGVRIGASPEWLATRLRAIGQRPINNVVDATNYVLHELGQPLHAFDLHRLGGNAIVVRRARADEQIVTLDGTTRALTPEMLVIADGQRPSAIAGIMGGRDSEVSAQTADVLIECAHFDRKRIRGTRRALGMVTDASYRYERGVDPTGMERALRRVIELIVTVAGGSPDTDLLDVYPVTLEAPTISVRAARTQQVLGHPFTSDQIRSLLEPIGFDCVSANQAKLEFRVPGHRWFDVGEEIDLIEEVARREGYDHFGTELRPFRSSSVPDHPLSVLEGDLRNRLIGRGLLEARLAAFAPEAEGDVALLNPLASTESRLRRALLPGLLHRVEYNFTRGTRDIRLFELGAAFATGSGGRPLETTRLAVALTGARAPLHWSAAAGDFELWDLKGILEELADMLDFRVTPGESGSELPGISAMLEPEARFDLWRNDRLVGLGGQLRIGAVDAPAWAARSFGFEVLLDAAPARTHAAYRALPVMPAIEQDLALVVPESVSAAQVDVTIRAAGGQLLEAVSLFDVYRGKGIPQRARSLAYRLRFRAADRTLTDAEVNAVVQRILKRLQHDHGIERRG